MNEDLDAWWEMDPDRLAKSLEEQGIPAESISPIVRVIQNGIAEDPGFRGLLETIALQAMWNK